MKVNNLILGVLLLLMGCQSVPQTSEYVVIAGKGITVDTAWNKVAASLWLNIRQLWYHMSKVLMR